MKNWVTISLMAVISILILILSLSIACGDDDDDDDGGSSNPTWYDESKTASENCWAFWTAAYDCYDQELDYSTMQDLCAEFDNWEDQYEDHTCAIGNLDDFWQCLGDLSCNDFDSINGFNSAFASCSQDYTDDILKCNGTCEDFVSFVYDDCGMAFYDTDNNDITKEDAIASCEY